MFDDQSLFTTAAVRSLLPLAAFRNSQPPAASAELSMLNQLTAGLLDTFFLKSRTRFH